MNSYQYRSCQRKIRWETRREATKAIKRLKKEHRPGTKHLVAYHCRFCGGWHTGNSRD